MTLAQKAKPSLITIIVPKVTKRTRRAGHRHIICFAGNTCMGFESGAKIAYLVIPNQEGDWKPAPGSRINLHDMCLGPKQQMARWQHPVDQYMEVSYVRFFSEWRDCYISPTQAP